MKSKVKSIKSKVEYQLPSPSSPPWEGKRVAQGWVQRGFTLAELLAVMMVFAVVGSIVGGILINSLRTSNKTTVVIAVKQNGSFALSQISKVLRDAHILKSPYPCGTPSAPTQTTTLQVVTNSGLPITLDCNAQTADTPSRLTIASNSASLLDTSAVSLVPGQCNFYCSQLDQTDYPVIRVSFFLNQYDASGSRFAERTASASAVEFSTSVTLRNINR